MGKRQPSSLSELCRRHVGPEGGRAFAHAGRTPMESHRMKILVIDIGGAHVKVLASGRRKRVEIASGPHMTPAKMVAAVRAATVGWTYDAVSMGYPGPVLHG